MAKKCARGGWKVVIGGSSSVRGVHGCYKTKAGAKAVVKRLRKKRLIGISTIWTVKA